MKNKKRRTTLSKLMAFCVAAVMILSMSVTAFANIESTTTATVTVNGLESDNGATVTAYKIADVNFNTDTQQLQEPVYTWVEAVAGWLKNDDQVAFSSYINKEDNSVTRVYMDIDAAAERVFLKALKAANLGLNPVTVEPVVMSNQTATFTVEMGQYMVVAEKDPYQYLPLTANVVPVYDDETSQWNISNATVSLKGSEPSIKKMYNDEDGQYNIGDTASYEITVPIPSYPLEDTEAVRKLFQVGDLLPKGLSLKAGTIEVKAGETVLVKDTDYTLSTDDTSDPNGNSYTFLVDFTEHYDEIVTKAGDDLTVTITYQADVTKDAFAKDALTNTAFVGYTDDPFNATGEYLKKEAKAEVYTYGFTVDKQNVTEHTPLSGAEFELSTATAPDTKLEFVKEREGVYKKATASEAGSTTTELVVSANGKLEVKGLDVGKYKLKEITAPAGYVLPEDPFTITLTDGNKDGILEGNGATTISGNVINNYPTVSETVSISEEKPCEAGFIIYNASADEAGFQLPKTGGMGTMIFTVCGILLMGGAVGMVVILLGKKKRESR